MANFINKYINIEAYNADNGKQYPNVSYLVDDDIIKFEKNDPVHIVAVYNVTSTSEATKLLYSTTGITYQIIDDVRQDTVQRTYTFDTLGEHIVKYKFDGTSISNGLFSGCSSLTSVTIPDIITSIGDNSFGECSSLTSIVIPNSVISIGNNAFVKCSSLESIVVDSANTVFDSRDNCNALINTSTNKLILGCKNTVIPNTVTSIGDYAYMGCTMTNIVIPNTITSIGEGSLENCSSLTNIVIPDSITSISTAAFAECSALTSIVIPNSVTSIADYAFQSCRGLTSIDIPNSVTSIGLQAFFGCSGLTNVTIGNSITSIGEGAFNNCRYIESVTIHATTPPTLASSSAFGDTENYPIYVPAESVDTYKQDANWRYLSSRIQAIVA